MPSDPSVQIDIKPRSRDVTDGLEKAAARHRVFAPDLPGYGRTDKPRARYTIPYFARFIQRYMDDRRIRSAALVGASLGGRVALEVALERPGLVRKLVLVNTLGLGRPKVKVHASPPMRRAVRH